MNTTEKNEIIRKFVGLETTKESFGGKPFYSIEDLQKVGINFSPGTHGNGTTELKFHSSWDWLMPVIEKITFDPNQHESKSMMKQSLLSCQLENTHQAVIEFITWYNEQTDHED